MAARECWGQDLHRNLGRISFTMGCMPFPVKTCAICSEEFELKPDKPGFANRCPSCSEPESTDSDLKGPLGAFDREADEARRAAMRDLLYRKDS
jgi:hypothetical protein